MDKTKTKNNPNPPNDRGFIAVWAFSHTVLWLWMWAMLDYQVNYPVYFSTLETSFPLTLLATALFMAILQHTFIARVFEPLMSGWTISSFLGAAFSIFTFGLVQSADLLVSVLTLLFPIALAQTLWMRPRVKSAWLWPMASVISTLFIVFPFRISREFIFSGQFPVLLLIFSIAQGGVQGVVMRYLWTQPRDAEKRKMDLATEGQSEQARVQRLEEHEANEAFEVVGDEPMTQYEAR